MPPLHGQSHLRLNMKLIPRDYQSFATQSIWNYFVEHPTEGEPLVAMPTGTGKSIVIADFLESIYKQFPTQRVMMLTHVKELIEQNFDKLMTMWPTAPAGIYSAGMGRKDTMHSIIFGGIASVAKNIAAFGWRDLLLIDEAHLVNPAEEGMYRKVIDALRTTNPRLRIIGFTATPWRLGHGKITEDGIFTDICCDMTGVQPFNWLIQQGYLMPLIPKQTKMELDTTSVHKRGGEFIASELQNAVNKKEITIAAIKEAMEAGMNRRCWLVFAAGVEHAIDTAAIMNDMGIPTIAIHGKLSKAEREQGLADFKAGKYRAAVNNNILTTGFDHPAIDLMLILRPTASPVLWVQILGRGTRPFFAPGYDITTYEGRMAAIQAGGKENTLVLDFAANTRSLGPINDPKIPHRKGEGGGEAPVKVCPMCDTYNHASVRFCCYCGAEFLIQTKLKQAASTQALVKMDVPITETFKVDHITTIAHKTVANDTVMKVSYYCGYKCFVEFIGIDHPNGGMRKKARDWWRARSTEEIPETTEQLIHLSDAIMPPTHLRVWTNKKYPEIMAACFDGTAFGKQESDGSVPQVEAVRNKVVAATGHKFVKVQDADIPLDGGTPIKPNFSDMDDDIPF